MVITIRPRRGCATSSICARSIGGRRVSRLMPITLRSRPKWSLHRRSIFFIPKAEEARTVPLGAGDGEGDLGEAVISLAVPGKAVSHHHHPLRLSLPLPYQNRTGTELCLLLVKASQRGRGYRSRFGSGT